MVPKGPQAGFSMLEVIIICAITVVIAAIAIPNAVTAYNGYQLQVAATALEQQLNRCRQEAVRANQPTKMKIAAHTARIDTTHDNIVDNSDEPAITLSTAAAVTVFNPSNGEVTYTSRGEMLIGVNASYTVTYLGRSRVVSVDPRGAVSIGPEQ